MATEQFANNAQTTLNGGINNSVTSLIVTLATGFPSVGNFRIIIDSEIMLVTAVSGTTFTVTRNVESTLAASHSNGASVTHVLTAAALMTAFAVAGSDTQVQVNVGGQPGADSNFVWDYTNHRLGLAVTPTSLLHAVGIQPVASSAGTSAGTTINVIGAIGGNNTGVAATRTGGTGGAVVGIGGAGGIASAATSDSIGGTGGKIILSGGAGGNTSLNSIAINQGGVGGNVEINGGVGGTGTGTTSSFSVGNVGGYIINTTGVGGLASGSSGTNHGGGSGNYSTTISDGGTGIGGTTAIGGNSGTLFIQGGTGGQAQSASGSNNGGVGTSIIITAGTGGGATNGTDATGGNGGGITLQPGGPGFASSGSSTNTVGTPGNIDLLDSNGMSTIRITSVYPGGSLVGFFSAGGATQQTGDIGTALTNFGLMSGTPTFKSANLTGVVSVAHGGRGTTVFANADSSASGVSAAIKTSKGAASADSSATCATHGVLVGNGTSVASVTGTTGQVFVSNGASADPTFQSPAYQGPNYASNGGFWFAQRQSYAPGTLTTVATDKYSADRWRVSSQAASLQYARTDTNGSQEAGLQARYYGNFKQITNPGKFVVVQPLEGQTTYDLAGTTVTFQCKLKASTSKTIRLGLLQLNSSGTMDIIPGTLVSAYGANSTDPTWATNVAIITPTAVAGGASGTVSGNAINCSVTTSWQVFGGTFTVPATAKNLILSVWTDSQFSANDILSMSEAGLYAGAYINTWLPLTPQQEFAKCQRYYTRFDTNDIRTMMGICVSTTLFDFSPILPVSTRILPAVVVSAASDMAVYNAATINVAATAFSVITGALSPIGNQPSLRATVAAGLTAGVVCWVIPTNVGAYLALDAEM